MKKLFICAILLSALASCKKDTPTAPEAVKEQSADVKLTILVNCDNCAINMWYASVMFYSNVNSAMNIPIVVKRGEVLKTSLNLSGFEDAGRTKRIQIVIVDDKSHVVGKADTGEGFPLHTMFNNDFKIK